MRSEKAPRPLSDLRGDDQGAIMIVGLAAALVLVGALWFLIGIADTLVWRDRMQEAVDAAAFSAAAIQARGMNFIAAMNLIMLALVTIHVVIGIVADCLTIIAVLCLPFAACGGYGVPITNAAFKVRKAQTSYDAFMWPTLGALNTGQTVIAVGAPWLGSAAGFEVGGEYTKGETDVATLGASNFPTGLPDSAGAPTPADGQQPYARANIRLGLPVAFERMNEMCKRPIAWAVDWVVGRLTSLPVLAPVLGNKLVATAVDAVISKFVDMVGGVIIGLECDDSANPTLPPALSKIREKAPALIPLGAKPETRWGEAGGKTMWGSAQNGSPWMQVWSWTTNATKTDVDEQKVGFARNVFGDIGARDVKGTWVAQAEFYFDCGGAEKWDAVACNGKDALGSHFALYNMHWLARLRRVKTPDLQRFLFDTATASFDALGWTNEVVGWIPHAKKQVLNLEMAQLYRGWIGVGAGFIRDQLQATTKEGLYH